MAWAEVAKYFGLASDRCAAPPVEVLEGEEVPQLPLEYGFGGFFFKSRLLGPRGGVAGNP